MNHVVPVNRSPINGMAPLNPLVTDTGSPPIPDAYGWLDAYDRQNGTPVLLSQAAPTDPPPQALLDRLSAAAADPATARYGDIRGESALRTAYASELSRLYGGRIGAEHVAITAGCNLAFVIAAMALARAGDAVLVPGPWYFNHKMSLDMLGIEAREIPCAPEAGFVPDVRDAEWLLDRRVKAIVLVTPNNPTGAIYPPATISAFHALCQRRGITLVLDETYRDFLPTGARRPHDLATDAWPENVIQLYSFSKAFHIPGYRLGAITAAPAVQREIAKLLDSLQICPNRVAQGPIAWALTGLADWRAENRARLARLGTSFAKAMAKLDGWRIRSIGSYFAYVEHPFPDREGTEVAQRLAEERGILVLPASFFGPGQSRFVRIAFANLADADVEPVVARIGGLSKLPPLDGRAASPAMAKRRLAKG